MESIPLQDKSPGPNVSELQRFSLLRGTWRLLNSFKFVIALLSIIALISFVGVLIPQGLPERVYIKKFGLPGHIILAFGLDNVFRTGWFLGMLAFLALDI
ncbi:hypothetical protein E3J62_03835 [candidate division TA06 bacterium]|uniref:ResB-like domain-containing protein n=1 Tax=candidate division TA06 bacterium TaxID=2250710 RepID=A0A523UVL5_UNCT6|nr:MAG: hypothetical protein E3J62_03835 [candidate division TA06 bacterium]